METFHNNKQIAEWIQNLEFDWNSIIGTAVDFLKNGAGNVLNSTVAMARTVVNVLMNFFIALVFAVYILLQKEKLTVQVQKVFYAFLSAKMVKKVLEVCSLSYRTFASFVTGQCLEAVILGTMFLEGASIEACVETIAKTLPVCKVREVAYATFSILQIFHNGEAYLVEFDNPKCVFVRDGKIVDYPYEERVIEDKTIREYRFQVELKDCFVLMSDGVIYAGVGELLNFGWTWESMAEYTLKCTKETLSASRLAAMLSQACDDLYGQKPGDDTTVAVARVIERRILNIFTGPPTHKEDDE